MMRTSIFLFCLVLGAAPIIKAAAEELQWKFSGRVEVGEKGRSPNQQWKFGIPEQPKIPSPLRLSAGEALSFSLQFQTGLDPSIPHQAFLYMKQDDTGLETFFPFDATGSTAKAKLHITHRNIPAALIASNHPLSLSLVIGGFTPNVKPVEADIGQLNLDVDAAEKNAASKAIGEVVRYEKKPEIRHVFRPDPKSPSKIMTLVFALAILASLVGLFGGWSLLGANLSALPQALKAAPISHPLFFCSIVAFEAIFFMYYVKWNLFQALSAMACVAPAAFLSGSKALTEFRVRRVKTEGSDTE